MENESVVLWDVIAALAMCASAVFVYLTLLRSKKQIDIQQDGLYRVESNQRVSSVDNLFLGIANINVPLIEKPESAVAIAKALKSWESLKFPEEKAAAHFFLFSFFKLMEDAWFQWQQGHLSAGQWDGWERLLRSYINSNGVESWWEMRKGAYSLLFQEAMTGIKAKGVPESVEPLYKVLGLED